MVKVRVEHLKLSASTEFGAFAHRSFGSVAEARDWVLEHIPETDLDLVRIWIDGRAISGRELKNITGEQAQP
jgi:hypothetical protein